MKVGFPPFWHPFFLNIAILFWDEKGFWLGSGGLKCENSVPKFERESHPDHWGGPIDPKLCEPSSYVHQTWSASKKSHFRTFAPSTPSGILGREITRYTVTYGAREASWSLN